MNSDNHDSGTAMPPALLREILEMAREASPSEERYRDAGQLAWKITRLRQERARLGFEPEPLQSAMSRLADTLSIDLTPILNWFDLTGFSHHQSMHALCNLGKELGIRTRELFAHLAFGLAAEEGVPVPAACRVTGATSAEDCSTALKNLPWESEAWLFLNRMERQIEDEYRNQTE